MERSTSVYLDTLVLLSFVILSNETTCSHGNMSQQPISPSRLLNAQIFLFQVLMGLGQPKMYLETCPEMQKRKERTMKDLHHIS